MIIDTKQIFTILNNEDLEKIKKGIFQYRLENLNFNNSAFLRELYRLLQLIKDYVDDQKSKKDIPTIKEFIEQIDKRTSQYTRDIKLLKNKTASNDRLRKQIIRDLKAKKDDPAEEVEIEFKDLNIKAYFEILAEIKEVLQVVSISKNSKELNTYSFIGKSKDLQRIYQNIKEYLHPETNKLSQFEAVFSGKKLKEIKPLRINFTQPEIVYFVIKLMELEYIEKKWSEKRLVYVFKNYNSVNHYTITTIKSNLDKELTENSRLKIENIFK